MIPAGIFGIVRAGTAILNHLDQHHHPLTLILELLRRTVSAIWIGGVINFIIFISNKLPMKILGLIGGMSWVSTIDYYKLINEGINQKLGGLNFSECMIYSFNYADIKRNNDANDWDANFKIVAGAAASLKNSGAAGIILCANTMPLIADKVAIAAGLPVINIATASNTDRHSNHASQKGRVTWNKIYDGARFLQIKTFG